MSNPTENFQNIWLSIIRLYESVWQKSSLEIENAFSVQKEKFLEAEKMIEEGADINEPFYDEKESLYDKYTPLGHVMSLYYYTYTTYMNNDFLDNMIYFLFSHDLITDKESIKSCYGDLKLLEEILKRANDEDIKFKYSTNIKYLEIITSFPTVKLDEFISYEFSYVNENIIYFQNYDYLPIEVVMLDYATSRGSKITNDEERKDVIHLFKKQGSPFPSLERIDIMFSLMEEKYTWKSSMDNIRKRFKEVYDFYITLNI